MADRRKQKLEAQNEAQRREEERRQFKAAQELESLRRTFKRINKKSDGKICTADLVEVRARSKVARARGARGALTPAVARARSPAGAGVLGAQDH